MKHRAVVIGAGRWGGLHAAKLNAHPDVDLVGVVDVDERRARTLALRYGVAEWAETLCGISGQVDVTHVATSIEMLAKSCGESLRRGCHVLVEKPVGMSSRAVEALIREAERRDRVVGVGFLERFNPMVPADKMPIDRFCFQRSNHEDGTHMDLGLDLAIHDIDLLHYLTGVDWRVTHCRRRAQRLVLHLRSSDNAEARIFCAAGRGPRHRWIWRDGQRANLLETSFDALGAEISAFLGLIRGRQDVRLAGLQDALRAVQVLESARALSVAA
ncbi:MAG: Gfo/Idh/MocA family oxidoreductase [Myxococcota bacterium]|nr:Gfo/Idh/MocA family oxidoreductase [Myxococcota bacterium]